MLIPKAVNEEIIQRRPSAPGVEALRQAPWLRVRASRQCSHLGRVPRACARAMKAGRSTERTSSDAACPVASVAVAGPVAVSARRRDHSDGLRVGDANPYHARVAELRARWLALATALIASGCGPSGTSLPTTPTATNSLLAPAASVSPSQLLVGDSALASVSGWSTVNGQLLYGPVPVTAWTSVNPAVAIVDGTGRVTAVGAGSTMLAATHRDGTATAGVVVYTESDIQALAVSCPASTPLPGGVFCMASGRTSGGGSVPVRATWSTSDSGIGRAESGNGPSSVGMIVGVAAGEVTVTASYREFRATTTVVFRN